MQEIMLFAVGLASLQILPVIAQDNREKEYLHFDEAFLIPMFIALSPIQVMLTMALAISVSSSLLGRAWYKTLFNTAQMSIAALLGGYLALSGTGLTGAVIGATVYAVLTASAVFVLFRYVLKVEWESNIPFRSVVLGTSLVLGIVMSTRLDLTPIVATATVGIQMGYQTLISRPQPVLSLSMVDV